MYHAHGKGAEVGWETGGHSSAASEQSRTVSRASAMTGTGVVVVLLANVVGMPLTTGA